jgi:hypothetical protein
MLRVLSLTTAIKDATALKTHATGVAKPSVIARALVARISLQRAMLYIVVAPVRDFA